MEKQTIKHYQETVLQSDSLLLIYNIDELLRRKYFRTNTPTDPSEFDRSIPERDAQQELFSSFEIYFQLLSLFGVKTIKTNGGCVSHCIHF